MSQTGSGSGSESGPTIGVTLTRVGAAILLLAGAYLVLRPFLTAMVWAGIVTYVSWPLYRRARDATGWPRATAGLFTLGALLVVGIPLSWFLIALADQGSELFSLTQDWLRAGAPQPEWLQSIPLLGQGLETLRAQIPSPGELASTLAGFSGDLSRRVVSVARGAASNVFSFSIMLLALFVFYTDGERLAGHVRRLSLMVLPQAESFLHDVGGVVRAVVFGLLGTAIVQGIMAGLGLAIFGVPQPVALGALTAILSFVPAGPVFIWGGAALWLFFTDHTTAAIGMLVWGALLVSSVDNVLRPILISRGGAMPIPFLVVLFGVLGGLAAFGLLGLFLGPVILSVTFALAADFPGHTQGEAESG